LNMGDVIPIEHGGYPNNAIFEWRYIWKKAHHFCYVEFHVQIGWMVFV